MASGSPTEVSRVTRQEKPVFDRRYDQRERLPATGGQSHCLFRRTDRERATITNAVTAQILGDPAPGRSAQDALEQRTGRR